MRKTMWIALAALTFVMVGAPAALRAQQNSNSQQSAAGAKSSQTSQASSSPAQEDPLAAAARKAREQRKNAPKAAKVFTNDNLPTDGGVSTVGEAAAPTDSSDGGDKGKGSGAGASAGASPAANDAATWRAKFAKLRGKLQRDQNELSVMQREIGQQEMQYYNGNPQKAAQDQASGQPLGEAYNKKKAEIDAKQKQVDADQQAISDAQDALRQAGGDPGWGR
jgi:hypothetical protein